MGKTAGTLSGWTPPQQDQPPSSSTQYWRNVGDADVMEVHPDAHLPAAGADRRDEHIRRISARTRLADPGLRDQHGPGKKLKQAAARALFGKAAMDTEHMPSTQLTEADPNRWLHRHPDP